MPDAAVPFFEVSGVHAWYGDSHVLHGIDLNVHRGEVVTLLGRNGAGKTTLLRSIMGILRRTKGSFRIGEQELKDLPGHKIALHGLGYVPEERGIFSTLSVAENLMLPPRIAEGGLSLEEIYELFPNLRERRKAQGTTLSGGEQQMLAMARILRTGVSVLLLDEPSEGLAPLIVQNIDLVLRMLKKRGMTILLVEQNFQFARMLAERFYVMENGRIVDTFAVDMLDQRMDSLQELLGV